MKILLASDGSPTSEAAVQEVASTQWPVSHGAAGTAIRDQSIEKWPLPLFCTIPVLSFMADPANVDGSMRADWSTRTTSAPPASRLWVSRSGLGGLIAPGRKTSRPAPRIHVSLPPCLPASCLGFLPVTHCRVEIGLSYRKQTAAACSTRHYRRGATP